MSKYSEQVKADAKAAADYIREHGWCQGRFFESEDDPAEMDGRGACCAAGATLKGGRYHTCVNPLYDALANEVGELVPVWNDTPGRTKEEVLAVFDKIANS